MRENKSADGFCQEGRRRETHSAAVPFEMVVARRASDSGLGSSVNVLSRDAEEGAAPEVTSSPGCFVSQNEGSNNRRATLPPPQRFTPCPSFLGWDCGPAAAVRDGSVGRGPAVALVATVDEVAVFGGDSPPFALRFACPGSGSVPNETHGAFGDEHYTLAAVMNLQQQRQRQLQPVPLSEMTYHLLSILGGFSQKQVATTLVGLPTVRPHDTHRICERRSMARSDAKRQRRRTTNFHPG